MSDFTGTYKGENVWFDVSKKVWAWQGGEAKTYTAVTAQIDKMLKANLGGLKAIYRVWGEEYDVVEIVSVASDGDDAWIKRGGKKENVGTDSLFAYTEKNLALLEEKNRLEIERTQIRKKIEGIVDNLDTLDIKELYY